MTSSKNTPQDYHSAPLNGSSKGSSLGRTEAGSVAGGNTLSEDEFREVCGKAGTMFIDETGYTAAVLMGTYRAMGSNMRISMDGDLADRLDRWKRDLLRMFAGTKVDVTTIFYQELSAARERHEIRMNSTSPQ